MNGGGQWPLHSYSTNKNDEKIANELVWALTRNVSKLRSGTQNCQPIWKIGKSGVIVLAKSKSEEAVSENAKLKVEDFPQDKNSGTSAANGVFGFQKYFELSIEIIFFAR